MYSEIYTPRMKKILPFILPVTLLSCSKLNEKKQFFGEWLIVKKELKGENGTLTDVTKQCELDDSEAYRNMGVWVYNPGNETCEEGELPTTGKWNYESSSKRLVYTNSAGMNTSEAYVELINSDSLIINLHVADNPSTTRITYKKVK